MEVENTAAVLNLQKLYKNEMGADVEFVLQKKCSPIELRIPAHKAILAASSPVFERMFFGDLKEGSQVTIVDASFEAFSEFLQFFYMKNVDLTEDNVIEVFKLIDKYALAECLPVCERFLQETITKDLVCLYYEIALLFDYSESVLQKLEEFICEKAFGVVKTNTFKKTNQIVLKNILELDSLICMECDIFFAVMAWAAAECEFKNLAVLPENLRAVLGDCLPLIRFPIMAMEEFAQCLEAYPGLLHPDEASDIQHYITENRPLTHARHFSNENRFVSEVDVNFWNENDQIQIRERRKNKSLITFNMMEGIDVRLMYVDFVFPENVPDDGCCRIFDVDNRQIQDFTLLLPLDRANDSKLSKYKLFRLMLVDPVLCTRNEEQHLEFTFELSFCISHFVKIDGYCHFEIDRIEIDFYTENLFVKKLHFKRELT